MKHNLSENFRVVTNKQKAARKKEKIMDDLNLAPTEMLVNELEKRYHAVVVGILREDTDKDESMDFYYHGGKVTCIGLCSQCEMLLQKEVTM